MGGHNVTLTWIPSHVGITLNERADALAKEATEREHIDIHCPLSTRQVLSYVKEKCNTDELERCTELYENSSTFRHYTHVNIETGFVYGSNVLVDTVTLRIRLGYNYYWEYGYEVGEADRMCRVCEGTTPTHWPIMSCTVHSFNTTEMNSLMR